MNIRFGSSHRREDGSSAVELVLLTPLLMFVVFLVVQAALYMHARHAVLAAAQQGARLARAQAVSDQTAVDSARAGTLSYLRQLGGEVVGDPAVDVTRVGGQATVRVSAHAVSILPGLTLRVVEVSSGPVEQFRAP
jgi:Flp pilus assembly protein TadG